MRVACSSSPSLSPSASALTTMPPDVVYVKLDAATRHAWIVPEGMVVWAMARAQHPGRTDSWRPEDARRMIALCRSMIDADLAGESPSPSARDARRDPQGRLLVDSHGFDRLLDGGLAGPAAALLAPAVAQAMTARLCALSRTPLRRLVVTLAMDLERGDDGGNNDDGDNNNNNNNREKGLARGGGSDDETQRRDAVAAFVRTRCVRGTESCSADTLYRAFVAWAATGAPSQRTIHRSDFWRAVAVHAAHAFDVGGGAHIVSGLALSHRDQPPRAHTPTVSSRRSTTAAHSPSPHAERHSPLGNRRPLDATRGRRGEQQDHAPDDGDDTEDDEAEPAERRSVEAGARHGDGERAERAGGPTPRPPRVRYDAEGYLAAIDLLHDATGMWDAPTAKTVAGRIMYALRQRGWNFQKRRIGHGRATPLLRAVDVDAFLAAAARAAGAGDTALSIAHYAETDAYLQLMACLGQQRDPLGRRAAAVHARDCIAACAVIESTVCQAGTPPPRSPLTPMPCPPLDRAADAEAVVQPTATWGPPPIDGLARRRLRQQSPTTAPSPISPSPSSSSLSAAQAPSRPPMPASRAPSPSSSSSPARVLRTVVPAKRSPAVSSSPARRVRRRIVPSSSSDDDDDNGDRDQDHDDEDGQQGHNNGANAKPAPGRHDKSRKDNDDDDDDETRGPPPHVADAKDHTQQQQQQQQSQVHPTHGDPMDDEAVDQQHRDADSVHGVGRPLDGPRAHPGNVCRESGANASERAVCGYAAPATKEDALAQEAHYNGMLVDEMASCATADLALCVWNRRAGLWRLVLAVRPGSDRQRPWRIIADHRAPPALAPSPSAFAAPSSLPTDVRWIEWPRVRSLVIDLLTTSPHTVLAVDADCEPPGDGPDARAVTVASSWLFVVCRAWALGRWPSSDAAVPALALRMAEVAAADPGGPHAAEAIAVAQACVQRLRDSRAPCAAPT